MEVQFDMKPAGVLMEERGLNLGGKVQKVVDNACIAKMVSYTPMRTGMLVKSVDLGTKIGSGKLEYASPYARYLYYGEIYGPNYPIYQDGELVGYYSPPKKEPTGREMEYSTSVHPDAGKLWFERMKADHKEEILAAARAAAEN